MARIKYIRVSTKEQNTARQEQDKALYDKIYLEKISGKDTNRPQLQAMLDYVREGDVVEVESYSRLARDTRDLLNIIDALNKKGVAFVSQKEQIDTSTPAGRFMLSVFASLAQFEREQILSRQAEGIAIAKQEGRMGRPENQALRQLHRDCGGVEAGQNNCGRGDEASRLDQGHLLPQGQSNGAEIKSAPLIQKRIGGALL